MAAEYYNFKDETSDRKAKLLSNPQYRDKLEIDQIMVKYTCIDKESPEEFQKQRYRFIIPEVNISHKATKVARKLADFFAFSNNWVFDQITRFNFRRNARSLEMLEKLKENVRDVYRQKDLIIDQLEAHLRDCNSRQEYLSKTKPKV